MKRSTYPALLVGLVTMLAMSTTLSAAAGHKPPTAPGQDKLLCFDGTTDGGFGGVCTLKANGAKGPATLNNTDSNPNGDYAGVYYANTTMTGQVLGAITQLSYNYSGTTVPGPGDLSLNVPVDTDGNGKNDAYLFIDAFYCPGTGGAVNIIRDASCGIFVNGVEYPNWAALVAAHPTWTVAASGALDESVGTLPFVIAERTPSEGPAFWTVSNVTLGKPGK